MTSYPSTSIASGPVKVTNQSSVQEFSIRVPKNNKKRYHVMRFNSNLKVDFSDWKTQSSQVKMERENNFKEFRGGVEEDNPKFGAGSEFGREAKDEARKRKFGIIARKYKPDDQPWLLKIGGKNGKKFKGIREGGVSENTAYYVFTHSGKGIIDAYPLQEWYKFQPIQRYKALSAEEAEEEFGRRNKIINYFSVMVKKRLRNDEDGELDGDEINEKKTGGKKKDRDLKISDMDDWVESEEDLSGSENGEDGEKTKKDDDDEDGGGKKKGKGKKGKKVVGKKKKKRDSDDEAFEESDDGDEEGRELDYISDSSESASDTEMKANKELKGVAEEDALRKLLNSESEDENEENADDKKDENSSHSEDESKKEDKDNKDNNGKKKKKKTLKKGNKKPTTGKKDGDSSSELSPNSSASDSDDPSPGAKKVEKSSIRTVKGEAHNGSNNGSRSSTPIPGEKRKLTNAEAAVAASKKVKLETSSPGTLFLPTGGDSGITEDAVRRYLMRKPMTSTELLQKFKSKKTGLSSEQMVNVIAQILKNINPVKQMIKNKMYLSIKPTPT